jgi:NAD dependent epimerase/dehydratase family enzyme
VFLRTGLVLGDGGALAPLRLATSLFAGARVGSGRQWWPWISLRDEVRAIVHLIDSKLVGPVNLVGPTPARSEDVTRELARLLWRPHLFVIPAFAIGFLGAAGRELLLWSQNVSPTALEKDGFRFEHRKMPAGLRWAIWEKRP